MGDLKKIVVIGPESTGKSTLCELLAKHYGTVWCPEYARAYLTERGSEYNYGDLLAIARGQVALEELLVKQVEAHSPLFIAQGEKPADAQTAKILPKVSTNFIQSAVYDIQHEATKSKYSSNRSELETGNRKQETVFLDTDLYVMKVWCEFVFNKCHTYILQQIAERNYDLYLLCNIDLPWTEDPLREYPEEKPRQELYRIYKDILINQHTPWVEISGSYEERLQTAVAAVDKLLGE